MNLSLERIFTDPRLFGVTTATPVQRAKCRIVAGESLGDLAEHPDVIEMMGGTTLPPIGERPSEVLDISAIRVGKSLFAAAFIVWLSQTVDLSGTTNSDIVRIFVVALKLEGTDAVMTHLVTNMIEKPALRSLLVDDPKDLTVRGARDYGLKLRHPSKRAIEVKCIPLDRGGGSGLSVYAAGVVVDEYPRMIGASDGVKNVEHFRDGVQGRLLPGAIYLATGSPWQPYGPAYDAVAKHFGKPTKDLIVLRTTGKANPKEWTPKKVAAFERRNPRAYKTDYLAQFTDGEETVFPPKAIEAATTRITFPSAHYGKAALFADPSALRHDRWAVIAGGWVHPVAREEDLYEHDVLGETVTPAPDGHWGPVVHGSAGYIRLHVDRHGDPIPRRDGGTLRPWFEVYDIQSWGKSSGARGLDLVKAVGELGRQYGCTDFHWDGYEQLMLGDMIRREGLRPMVHPWSQAKKTECVDHLRTLFIERRIKLPEATVSQETNPQEMLKQELVRFRARATPGGNFQYVVTGGEGHGDHASCLLVAMRADLEGFVDRSPTMRSNTKNEVLDYEESEEFGY